MRRTSLILVVGLLFFSNCVKDKTTPNDRIIRLKWNKSYADDSFEKGVIGLAWTFSHIGAKNTRFLSEMAFSNDIFAIRIEQLGFSTVAEKQLEKLNQVLIQTEEFQRNAAIDMGRYVSLLLGASEHYYSITEMPETYWELIAEYDFVPDSGYLNNSSISEKHRVIKFTDQLALNQLFVSEEIDSLSGEILEYETADIMANGQLRFGIFDADGSRKNSSNALNSLAGKPAKCMWCHESAFQPLFLPQLDFEGYLTALELSDTLSYFRTTHATKLNQLSEGVDYANLQEHVFMELLYVSFMEPSVERLSEEWNMSTGKVLDLLEGLPTHVNEEFPFLGELYDRKMIEPLAPFKSLAVSSSMRETSEEEVNHLWP